jgi:adenylate kinase family enzyme
MHLVLMGSPGSGKTTQCDKLLSIYQNNSVKYEMGTLLKQYATEESILDNETKSTITQLINVGKLKSQVPTEIIETVQKHYLNNHTLSQHKQTNNLFIYYNGPMTLQETQRCIIVPDIVIVLQCEDEGVLIDRVCNRRVDTVTGQTYHLVKDKDILTRMNIINDKQRLRCRLGDDEILFRSRLGRYRKRSEPILEFYREQIGSDNVIVINADQTEQVIHSQIVQLVNQKLFTTIQNH